jgi:hypothetical protein
LIRAIDGNPNARDFPTRIEVSAAGPVRVLASSGQSIYHALQARADLRVFNTLEGGLSYTFSKLIDDVPASGSVGGSVIGAPSALGVASLQSFAQNPLDVSSGERGLSSLDRRHVMAGHFLWSLPLPRPRSQAVARLLNGWQVASILEMASGAPYTPMQQMGYSPDSTALFASTFSERFGSIRPFV